MIQSVQTTTAKVEEIEKRYTTRRKSCTEEGYHIGDLGRTRDACKFKAQCHRLSERWGEWGNISGNVLSSNGVRETGDCKARIICMNASANKVMLSVRNDM